MTTTLPPYYWLPWLLILMTFLWFAGKECIKLFNSRQKVSQESRDAIVQLAEALKSLDTSKLADILMGQEKLFNGLEEMCKELCRSNDAFIKVAEVFQRSIDGSSYRTGNQEEDDDNEDELEVRTLMRKGLSQAEAEARVRERRLYSRL